MVMGGPLTLLDLGGAVQAKTMEAICTSHICFILRDILSIARNSETLRFFLHQFHAVAVLIRRQSI